jgi:ribulose-phosphate 3-epimerase
MSEIEIIPSINGASFKEVQEKIKLVEPHVSWAHLDVADGSFTDITLWHNPKDLLNLHTPLFIEVHLMLEHIDRRVEEWLEPNVRRIIFHREASENPNTVIAQCRAADIQAGIAIRPDTPVDAVLPFLARVDMVQTLAVLPGPAGQSLLPGTYEKITALHAAYPACPIEVDGGINAETAPRVVHRGASLLVAASAIFNQPDIKQAIDKLKRNARA